jgi:hypothetical protein
MWGVNNRHLHDEGVECHPDQLTDEQLRDRAWAAVRRHSREARGRVVAQYRQLAGTGRTSNDVAETMAAAYQG